MLSSGFFPPPFELFGSDSGQVFILGAGSWKLTCAQRERIIGTQLRMVRRMLGMRRRPMESMDSYCARRNSRVNSLLTSHGIDKWDIQQFKMYYDWMGHVARMEQHSAHCITYLVLRYRDLGYISAVKREFGHQTHGRRLHVWRLEWGLFKHDRQWQTLAQSSVAWRAQRNDWLCWRLWTPIAG